MLKRLTTGALAGCLLLTVAPAAQAAPAPVRYLGEQIIPHALPVGDHTIGELSSIDYDPRTGQYVFIADDTSEAPARYFTAKIPVSPRGLGQVTFTGAQLFRQPDGSTYPEDSVDPEEMRVDPWTGAYYWSQEGIRSDTTLIDPSVQVARRDGGYVRTLPLPDDERMRPDSGPRRNLVLEGLTFAAAGTLVVSSVEGPLLQDGPVATPAHGALSRITVQARTGPVLAQYAYPQEPVFADSVPPGGTTDTGVSSILAADPFDPTRYLVMERSYVSGVGNKVRIYEIDTTGATNVLHTSSLDGAKVRPVKKKLLLDLADYPLSKVDNVEGMTWGPTLPGGDRTLLLVSDDNFSTSQITQVIAFAVRR
ncbi:hypothetical protein HNR02_001805 [Amycolatopsis endophytica]|uniref:Phytase-like domain-containing protein n=1 Tax=Amycolatopsis endophytica TaxID=860233 RepID=A0A853B0R4_9PSEU|nr:hypothetical protein [Amycolatopsis endophytica]